MDCRNHHRRPSNPNQVIPSRALFVALLCVSGGDGANLAEIVLKHGQVELIDIGPVPRHFDVFTVVDPNQLQLRGPDEGNQRIL